MHVSNNAKLQYIQLWLIALEMAHDAAQWFDSPLEGLTAMQSARANNEPSHWVLWDPLLAFGKVQAVYGKQMACL